MKYLHPRSMYTLPCGGVQRGYPLCGVWGGYPPGWGVWGKVGPQWGFGGSVPRWGFGGNLHFRDQNNRPNEGGSRAPSKFRGKEKERGNTMATEIQSPVAQRGREEHKILPQSHDAPSLHQSNNASGRCPRKPNQGTQPNC
jgi:hypothetical protein